MQSEDTRSGLCSAADSQLVVVDFQIKLAAAMPDKIRARVVQQINLLLQAAQALEVPVLVTEQYPKGLGPTLPEIRACLPQELQCFDKTRFSCCGASGFPEALEQNVRPQIVLCGIEAHVCVLQTALELKSSGWQVFVVEDAVCSRRKQHFRNAMARLRQAGVVVSNAESVIFEWVHDSGHSRFKKISQLLR